MPSSVKAKRKPSEETAFRRSVVKDFATFGWLVHHARPSWDGDHFRTPLGGHRGFMDLIAARAGVIAFIELKTDSLKSVLDDFQVAWLNAAAGVEHDAAWWGERKPVPNHVTRGNDSGFDVLVAVLRPSQRAWFDATFCVSSLLPMGV